MSNILDAIKGYITPELISSASSVLGESESGVSSTLSAAIPAILGGLVSKTGDSNAMSGIFSMITQTNKQGDVLSGLGSLLGPQNANNPFLALGGKFLGSLFGNKTGELVNMVASTAGVKKDSASSLIGMAVPMIMGFLGKKVASEGLNIGSLTSLLLGQKSNIMSAIPSGMVSSLGLSGLGNLSGAQSSGSTSSESKGGMSWLLPALLGLLLLGGALYFWKGCNPAKEGQEVVENVVTDASKKTEEVAKAVDTTAKKAVEATKDAANGLWANLGKLLGKKLPNGIELNIPENGVENKIISFIEDKTKAVDKTTWFDFDRLLFDTGKSTLKAESVQQLKDVAEILKAYPQVELKIGGYTDNQGNAANNLKLSEERAKAVVAELAKNGIDAKRLVPEGYGIQFPVADNNTEEGRAKNRRISMRITKK
ncbi:MAG: DUF937 domain-containing protein [Bacteroidia bacterium]|nr:DUF937 domain-containing protein [Bacteroidia bacterium]